MKCYQKTISYLPVVILCLCWEVLSFLLGESNLRHIHDVFLVFFDSMFSDAKIKYQGGGNRGYSVHVFWTCINFFTGLFLGCVIGISIALFQFYNQNLRKFLEPITEMLRVVPPLILVPFILLISNASEYSNFIVVSIYVALTLYVYALNSFLNIDKNYLHQSQLFNCSLYNQIIKVTLPAALPELVGGLRVTIALGIGVLVVAEYIGSSWGIGKVISYMISFSDVNRIMVGVIWSIIIVSLFDFIIVYFLKKVAKWHYLSNNFQY